MGLDPHWGLINGVRSPIGVISVSFEILPQLSNMIKMQDHKAVEYVCSFQCVMYCEIPG